MIECIFTVDYEIYGNGEGSLKELVYDPTEKLAAIFRKRKAPFVAFVEAAELEKIEEYASDGCIGDVRRQVRELFRQGFEIGLHLHPQWYNARQENGTWILDQKEYNLCSLPRPRVEQMVRRSVAYLRDVVGHPDFTPLAYRAGNWLLQPTETAAAVLAESGIKIDSSVFKGGLQRNHRLDYRRASRNGYYWPFHNDVNSMDAAGPLIEIPTHTIMVPFWKMLTTKRVGLHRKGPSKSQSHSQRINRLLDFLRLRYPLKFDFCRMTTNELTSMIERVIREDRKDPASYKPIVAIGHTKDLIDLDSIGSFLDFLKNRKINVTTFREVYDKCRTRSE